jgi:hypothetical protein
MEASWTRSESKKLKRDPLIVQAQVDYKTTWSNRSQATLELVDIRQPDFHRRQERYFNGVHSPGLFCGFCSSVTGETVSALEAQRGRR